MMRKKLVCLGLILAMVGSLFGCGVTEGAPQSSATAAQASAQTTAEAQKNVDFSDWTDGAQPLQVLTDYVQDVTDENSENFIPVEDRIAVFDVDGTLLCEQFPSYIEWLMFIHRALEDPTYDAPEDVRQAAEQIQQSIAGKDITVYTEKSEALLGAQAFAGMTMEEYADYVRSFAATSAEGFENLTRGEAFYRPMLQVISYLQENDFVIYLVSGTDRFMVRTLVENVISIPARQVIGMDVTLVASHQDGKDGLDYVYTSDDVLQRGDSLIVKNVKMNKVSAIAQEIGQQPVLAFGNSSGDASMLTYTVSNNAYKSAAFVLVNDDTQREYGNLEKSEKMRATAKECGWNVISMKDDFKTIYGENVTRSAASHAA